MLPNASDAITWSSLIFDRQPDPSEIKLLLEAHGRATARRDHEREVAEKERQLQVLARQLMRGERVPPNAVSDSRSGQIAAPRARFVKKEKPPTLVSAGR